MQRLQQTYWDQSGAKDENMQIATGVHSLDTRRGGRVHAFLIEDADGLTLIDTLYEADAEIIFDYLITLGKRPQDIKRILLTHSHKSHIGGLAEIVDFSGAAVMAHEWEIPIIEGKRKAEKVGWKLPKPFNLEVYALQAGLNAGLGKHNPVKVNGRLKEGMKVGNLEVIAVPGHTPGCVAFWWPEKRALIAGDTVSTWPFGPEISWPTFDLDHKQAQRSVAKMAELKPLVVGVGHGSPITEFATDILDTLAKNPI